jgi:hypothetical protein
MDTITDMLSVFFVSNNARPKPIDTPKDTPKDVPKDLPKDVPKDVPTETLHNEIDTPKDVPKDVPTKTLHNEIDTSSGGVDTVDTSSGDSEDTDDTSDSVEDTVESEDTDDTSSGESEDTDDTSDSVEDTVESEDTDDTSSGGVESTSEKPTRVDFKKCVIRASDMCRRHIILVNKELSESISVLSDIIHSFNLLRDVDTTFSSKLNIVSESNRKSYKKMLLENPYLYFDNFNVQKQLSKQSLEEMKGADKKSICIFDEQSFLKLSPPWAQDAHNVLIIVVCTEYSMVRKIYNQLGSRVIVMHKRDKLKAMEKQFYTKIVKPLCESSFKDVQFEEYYSMITDEKYSLRNIIIKEDCLRFN